MSGPALLDVDGLTVSYGTRGGRLKALDAVSFSLSAGETLAIVGESGSGKSTVALAAMGLLGSEAQVTGAIRLVGQDLTRLAEPDRRKLRGRVMSVVFQDPFTSLNPSLPIGLQVAESLIHHNGVTADNAREKAIAALAEVALPDPEALLSAYPHQLSGGMQQRVLIASALICDPALIILDEPTTALDVTVEARILDLLDEIRRRRKLGMLFITHNLGVVNRIADRILVLYAGRIAEVGSKQTIITTPAHPYSKGLLASLPRLATRDRLRRLEPIPGRLPDMAQLDQGCVFAPRCPFREPRCSEAQTLQPVGTGHQVRCCRAVGLATTPWPATRGAHGAAVAAVPARGKVAVEGVSKVYRVGRSMAGIAWTRWHGLPWPTARRSLLKAVDGVSFGVEPGEALGLVGESGSGKSTLARLILRLIEPTGGRIVFDGIEVNSLTRQRLRAFRKNAQIIFQNPDSSLNPRRRIGDAIARAVKLHTTVPADRRRRHVEDLIDRVGLPRSYYDRYPHQLSGGEKQRVGIARALATEPAFVVCDEPVSALDVSVQATILNLLADLRENLGLSYLFISHDLSVVAHIADRIAVMYQGQLVEVGPTRAVLEPPYHPYTEALLASIPLLDASGADKGRGKLRSIEVAAGRAKTGCRFHDRCPRKLGAICEAVEPPLMQVEVKHSIACHIPLGELAAVATVLPRNRRAEVD
jgi:peptide/nickel transport system ATP-binding protein